ncbi:MAG TPA: GNAT family N-acetyltransferase, partial [Burkholderiales bacterium]|nr:GNAT family N-acetyltransferase [Burkholderiales bacterium]
MNADKRREGSDANAVLDQIAVLPVEPGEVERIAALAGEIWRRHYAGIISAAQIEYMLKQRYEPPLIHSELARTDLWWDKLLVRGEIAGFASYFLTGHTQEMKLDKLYVHQDHQRKGYGGRLIDHVCELARRLGCSRVVLAVNRNNRNA